MHSPLQRNRERMSLREKAQKAEKGCDIVLGKHVGRLSEQRIFPGAFRTLSHLSLPPQFPAPHTAVGWAAHRTPTGARASLRTLTRRPTRCCQHTCRPQLRAVRCISEREAQRECPKSPDRDRMRMASHASSLSLILGNLLQVTFAPILDQRC